MMPRLTIRGLEELRVGLGERPLQPSMKLISVDDHLIEHPGVWSDRLPGTTCEQGRANITT
jgi:hypothetical protein